MTISSKLLCILCTACGSALFILIAELRSCITRYVPHPASGSPSPTPKPTQVGLLSIILNKNMQNEPNFSNTKIFLTPVIRRAYPKNNVSQPPKNEPKTKPIHKMLKTNVTPFITIDYIKKGRFRPKKTNPIFNPKNFKKTNLPKNTDNFKALSLSSPCFSGSFCSKPFLAEQGYLSDIIDFFGCFYVGSVHSRQKWNRQNRLLYRPRCQRIAELIEYSAFDSAGP